MINWINAGDLLPEDTVQEERVRDDPTLFLVINDGEYDVVSYAGNGAWKDSMLAGISAKGMSVTHWIPFPEKPDRFKGSVCPGTENNFLSIFGNWSLDKKIKILKK